MATDQVPNTMLSQRTTAGGLSLTDIVKAIVMPLASLKLTVVLLALAIFVIFIATLEQTRGDVYFVKMRHFSKLFVDVPFQVFFTPSWSPSFQNVPGQFVMPSGFSILAMMLINLTAAHTMRFKLQARGSRLLLGLGLAAFAGFVTWAVIFNGQNSGGFQATPPISYKTMWLLMQFGVLVLAISAVVAAIASSVERQLERLLLFISSFVALTVLAITVYFGESAFIGDAAMRVMWQLIQATMAAVVSYVACVFLFNRKAGMVLLHLGVAGLMVNEIFVTVTNNEQRMTVFEKDTVSHVVDIRKTEMAVINMSDSEFDEIVTIPSGLLKSKTKISNDDLPFDIQCLSYLPSSRTRAANKATNLANRGIGLMEEAVAVAGVAGTDSEQVVDFASAYVELLDKETGDSLGVHLLSQELPERFADRVNVNGTEYRITLRFKTEYKPYSVFLKEATQVNYPGTSTPKYYGSEILLDDFRTEMKTEQRIFMNNPLRYSDETFYQAGMDKTRDGREYSVIQIVTNVGWMIPYVCCMFSVVGLVAQFSDSLLAFLVKQRKQSGNASSELDLGTTGSFANFFGLGVFFSAFRKRSVAKASAKNAPSPIEQLEASKSNQSQTGKTRLLMWLPALILVFVGLAWGLSQLSKGARPVVKNEMRLDLLGQLPVTFEGRVQPLESYAINTARQLREREMVADGENVSRPAIQWFADITFGADAADDYRTFYITDPTIISALGLPKGFSTDLKRKKYVYTIKELMDKNQKLNSLIPDERVKPRKTWSALESRLYLLRVKIQRALSMEFVFGANMDELSKDFNEDERWLQRINRAGFALSTNLTPFIIPVNGEDKAWMPMTEANSRIWLEELGKELDAENLDEIAEEVIEQNVIPAMRRDMVKDRIIARFMTIPDFVDLQKQAYKEDDLKRLAALIKRDWDQLPEELRSGMETREAPLVDLLLQQDQPKYVAELRRQMRPLNGMRNKLGAGGIAPGTVSLLNKLRPAYLSGDSKTFNETLESYLAETVEASPKGYSPTKFTFERFYNSFTPFYLASALYLAAAIFAMLSWLGFALPPLRISMSRTAVGLILVAVAFHMTGIVMRVIISGRPPVTNLYSSVLFVSVASVILLLLVEMITRMGIGSVLAGLAGFAALIWAHSMTIVDGDTFSVMVAVLDTTFWLATHVVCISLGYAATFVAGLLGAAYIIAGMLTPALQNKKNRKLFVNLMYGVICFGLLASYFGTVLGGLWGDDSWGRFWGWDPKENGALMIVLANALILHARWGGMVKERGMAALAVLGNIIVLWSWKGVNALGVGLHAYAGTEDNTLQAIVLVAFAHLFLAVFALVPTKFWMSYQQPKETEA